MPVVPVSPALSLCTLCSERQRASARESPFQQSGVHRFSPVTVQSCSRDLEFLAWIDQVRIVDEVFIGLVDRPPLVGVPISRLAIFERLSPFTTTYVFPKPIVAIGSGTAGAVDDPPDFTLLKSGLALAACRSSCQRCSAVFTPEQLVAVAGESRFQHADASCVGADRDGRPCGYDAERRRLELHVSLFH